MVFSLASMSSLDNIQEKNDSHGVQRINVHINLMNKAELSFIFK